MNRKCQVVTAQGKETVTDKCATSSASACMTKDNETVYF